MRLRRICRLDPETGVTCNGHLPASVSVAWGRKTAVENHSKFRVVAKAVKHHHPDGVLFYRSNYRILDHIGEEIDAADGTQDYSDVTSAYNEAFELGRERLRELASESIQ